MPSDPRECVVVRPFGRFFFFSALGASRSPPGVPINQVDQLVWLFGAVAERKPRSTTKGGQHADL
jgi:hypothetical protein